MGAIGKLFVTDFTERDIWDCIRSYHAIVGSDPVKVVVREPEKVSWLVELGIDVQRGSVRADNILLCQ